MALETRADPDRGAGLPGADVPEAALGLRELGHGQPAAVRAELDEGRVARQLPGQPAGGDLPDLDVLAFPGRRGDPAAVGADRTLVETPVGTEPGDFGRFGRIQDDGLAPGDVVSVTYRPVLSQVSG